MPETRSDSLEPGLRRSGKWVKATDSSERPQKVENAPPKFRQSRRDGLGARGTGLTFNQHVSYSSPGPALGHLHTRTYKPPLPVPFHDPLRESLQTHFTGESSKAPRGKIRPLGSHSLEEAKRGFRPGD